MDFTQQPYFTATAAPPYQQVFGVPPLTPSHTHSVASKEFDDPSPPGGFDHFPGEQFHGFDAFGEFNAPPNFPGPPTPPNQPTHPRNSIQRVNGAGSINDKTNGVNGIHHAVKPVAPVADLAAAVNGEVSPEDSQAQNRRAGSNSDDEENGHLTPAQSRRKAQNRAAQRAFRERKERHVKDLEAKLANLEAAQHQTASENERLKRDLQKMSTENEILRATSHLQHGPQNSVSNEQITTGPMKYNPTDFYSNVLSTHPNKTPSHRVVTSDDGERLLAAGATWDFIISHPLFKRGMVDVGEVSNRLKHLARCDGQGPVFAEKDIINAIQSSVASGSDELL